MCTHFEYFKTNIIKNIPIIFCDIIKNASACLNKQHLKVNL